MIRQQCPKVFEAPNICTTTNDLASWLFMLAVPKAFECLKRQTSLKAIPEVLADTHPCETLLCSTAGGNSLRLLPGTGLSAGDQEVDSRLASRKDRKCTPSHRSCAGIRTSKPLCLTVHSDFHAALCMLVIVDLRRSAGSSPIWRCHQFQSAVWMCCVDQPQGTSRHGSSWPP